MSKKVIGRVKYIEQSEDQPKSIKFYERWGEIFHIVSGITVLDNEITVMYNDPPNTDYAKTEIPTKLIITTIMAIPKVKVIGMMIWSQLIIIL